MIAQKLLIKLDSILDFFVLYYFLELLLEIGEKPDALGKFVLLLPILIEVVRAITL